MGVDYYNCEICGDIFADAGHYGHCGNCEATLCGDCYGEMQELHGILGEDHPRAGWYGEDAPNCCSLCDGTIIDEGEFVNFIVGKLGKTREELEAEFRERKENEPTPSQKLVELFTELSNNPTNDEYTFGVLDGIKDTLTLLGIKIEGVNA